MVDISSLFRVEPEYQWSIAKSDTGHYICRIWQDKVINRIPTRVLYVGKFGDKLQNVVDECYNEWKSKRS